jgi:dienelactone hydrolase
MGERDTSERFRPQSGTGCYLVWARLNQMGLDLTGFRLFELMTGLNLLAQHPAVDSSRLGCAGLSGGCWLSQVLAALDRRVKAVILSGFFTTFVQTTWHGHCICHHPFGIGEYCDLPDIAAHIAPRPLFVESGTEDAPYPHEPAWSLTQRAYDLQGAGDRPRLHRYPGGHMFNGEQSIPWMVEQLQR